MTVICVDNLLVTVVTLSLLRKPECVLSTQYTSIQYNVKIQTLGTHCTVNTYCKAVDTMFETDMTEPDKQLI